eukprot:Rmarinus@m.12921
MKMSEETTHSSLPSRPSVVKKPRTFEKKFFDSGDWAMHCGPDNKNEPCFDEEEMFILPTEHKYPTLANGGHIMFRDLPDAQKKALREEMIEVKFKKGEIIIRQGSFGDNFYVVKEGKCKIVEETLVDTPNRSDSKPHSVNRTVGPAAKNAVTDTTLQQTAGHTKPGDVQRASIAVTVSSPAKDGAHNVVGSGDRAKGSINGAVQGSGDPGAPRDARAAGTTKTSSATGGGATTASVKDDKGRKGCSSGNSKESGSDSGGDSDSDSDSDSGSGRGSGNGSGSDSGSGSGSGRRSGSGSGRG